MVPQRRLGAEKMKPPKYSHFQFSFHQKNFSEEHDVKFGPPAKISRFREPKFKIYKLKLPSFNWARTIKWVLSGGSLSILHDPFENSGVVGTR